MVSRVHIVAISPHIDEEISMKTNYIQKIYSGLNIPTTPTPTPTTSYIQKVYEGLNMPPTPTPRSRKDRRRV